MQVYAIIITYKDYVRTAALTLLTNKKETYLVYQGKTIIMITDYQNTQKIHEDIAKMGIDRINVIEVNKDTTLEDIVKAYENENLCRQVRQ